MLRTGVWKRCVRHAFFAAALTLTGAAAADDLGEEVSLLDTFGPDDSFVEPGYTGTEQRAYPLSMDQVWDDFFVTAVVLGIRHVPDSGPNEYTIALHANAGGVPGEELERVTIEDVPLLGSGAEPMIVEFSGTTMLHGRRCSDGEVRSYWIVAAPSQGAEMAWPWDPGFSQSQTATRADSDGAWTTDSAFFGAVRVRGAALASPCPGTWSAPFENASFGIEHVRSVIEFDGDLIVGGRFTEVGGLPANRIARWDGQRWRRMGAGFELDIACPPGPIEYAWPCSVDAMTVWNGELVVGGLFTLSGTQPMRSIARWDGERWRPIDPSLADPGCRIEALTTWNGDLIAAGRFTFMNSDGQEVESLARWNGTKWVRIGNAQFARPGNPNTALVFEVAEWQGELVVGGDFSHINGIEVNGVARWNGQTWRAFDRGLVNIDASPQPHTWISALCEWNGDLIAAGRFITHTPGGVEVGRLARWNGESWQPLGEPFLCGSVYEVLEHDGALFAFGQNFSRGGVGLLSESQESALRWDGQRWHPVGEGSPDSVVFSATTVEGGIVIGGRFTAVGDLPAEKVAMWNDCAVACATDLDGDGRVGSSDLAIVISNWGACEGGCPADLDGDGVVGSNDLASIIAAWGPCS